MNIILWITVLAVLAFGIVALIAKISSRGRREKEGGEEHIRGGRLPQQATVIPRLPPTPVLARRTLHGPILVANADVDVDLIYRNSIGESIPRRVTIHEIHGVAHKDESLTLHHISGYCHLRHAPRTFRFDRMMQASHPETGELGASPADLIAKICGLAYPIRRVSLRTDDLPVSAGASRKVAVTPIEIDDGSIAFTEHFRVRVDTVYGNGAGFEGMSNRAKTVDRRGWGGRKLFSAVGDQSWRVRKATGPDGKAIVDLAAWLQRLPDAPANVPHEFVD
jgi:hypothetical protein